MANRYPLILDTTDGNRIKELPAGDNLYLRNNSIEDVQDINALGTINAAVIRIAGEKLVAQQFVDLTDVPNNYTNQANKFLKVKDDESGIEFVPLDDLGTISVSNVIVNNGSIEPLVDNQGNLGDFNKRFFRAYAESFVGNVRGVDGTLLVNGFTNQIPYAAIFGAPTGLSEFTNDTDFINSTQLTVVANGIITFVNQSGFVTGAQVETLINNKFSQLDAVGSINLNVIGDDSVILVDVDNSVLKTYTLEQVGATAGQALVWSDINQRWEPGNIPGTTGTIYQGDVLGSIFADDSTLLVDAVSGTIPGYVSIQELKTLVADSTDFSDFQLKIAAL